MQVRKILKNSAILMTITLVAGIALGYTYGITEKPIANQKELKKQEAYKAVFKEATEFAYDDAIEIEKSSKILQDDGITGAVIDEVVKAVDNNGELLGYVMNITSKEGYGGDIRFSLGIDIDGTTTGVSILAISETAGLGMKAKTTDWTQQFTEKQVEHFSVTKSQSSSDSEVEAISGATITSSAMTEGVNAGLSFFRSLQEGRDK